MIGVKIPSTQAEQLYYRVENREEISKLSPEFIHSFAMDEKHLYRAVRYVGRNPVAAGICRNAISWRWSSARAHVSGKDDALCRVEPMLNRVGNWNQYLSSEVSPEECEELRRHIRTGRPLGNDQIVNFVEELTGRNLKPGKPGPKPSN